MKTPITVLQETMMKLGETPEYECVAESGPHHQALFEYTCRARGLTAAGRGRSKKEAKQEAARAMLRRLAVGGGAEAAPAEWAEAEPAAAAPRSHVALLKELCEEYRLPGAEYSLVGDTGPPHARRFTVRAALGRHAHAATASTKKAARQMAAEALYSYLRDNLRRTADFVEEEALARAHERVMERYREAREEVSQRPRLAQRLADYHLGLHEQLDETALALGSMALAGAAQGRGESEQALAAVAAALGLQLAWAELAPLHVATLAPSTPPLAFGGPSRAAAAAAALRYLRRSLPAPPSPPSPPAPSPASLH